MKRSTERILTTHTGSLPRPRDLTALLEALDAGQAPDSAAFEARIRRAVTDVVRQQVTTGVDVMKEEYDAIHRAGFVLQVDCPDLAMGRHLAFHELSNAEFVKIAEANVEALNHALRDIPPDRMRLHLCWGNYEGPHHRDIPLKEILPIALKSRPQALSFEGANPRHEHEWIVFKDVKLPDDRLIIPGVLDSTTNFIEHPELVAQRLVRYAEIVGRERVMAGTDCGFATFARSVNQVEPEITWAKFKSMAEGARLASKQLWR